jgi:hypothetical protein
MYYRERVDLSRYVTNVLRSTFPPWKRAMGRCSPLTTTSSSEFSTMRIRGETVLPLWRSDARILRRVGTTYTGARLSREEFLEFEARSKSSRWPTRALRAGQRNLWRDLQLLGEPAHPEETTRRKRSVRDIGLSRGVPALQFIPFRRGGRNRESRRPRGSSGDGSPTGSGPLRDAALSSIPRFDDD